MFGLFIFCIIIAGIIGFVKTPYFKGMIGEYKVKSILVSKLNACEYTILNDILLSSCEGTTQVDHIVLSKYGIFVIETKNYNHWIFGSEKSPTWRQQKFKLKYNFQNPLHQNYKHIKTIEKLTGIEIKKIFNIVVFTGECQFKKDMPPTVVKLNKLVSLIHSYNNKILENIELKLISEKILEARIENSFLNKLYHIESIRINREGKKETLGSKENIFLSKNINRKTLVKQIFAFVKSQEILKFCAGPILTVMLLFSIHNFLTFAMHHYSNNAIRPRKNINKVVKSINVQKNKAVKNLIQNDKSLPIGTPTTSPQNSQINFQQSKLKQPNRIGERQVMYSWTNEDGHKTFSNKGFPEDGNFTNGKIERY